MSSALESLTDVTGKGPYVCSLAADHADGYVRQVALGKFNLVNDQRLGFEFHLLSAAGHLVGALAIDLAGREGGRHLLNLSLETFQHLLYHLTGDVLRGVGGVYRFLKVI